MAALTSYLSLRGVEAGNAEIAAKAILAVFDLAPAGTLTPLIAEVARLARGEKYQG